MYQSCQFGEKVLSLAPVPTNKGARAKSSYLYFSAWGGYAEIGLGNC
jgi:hypothetical protein